MVRPPQIPRVWAQSRPCRFGLSVFDSLAESADPRSVDLRDHWYDRMHVSLDAAYHGSLALKAVGSGGRGLILGRARDAVGLHQSFLKEEKELRRVYTELAAVGIIRDSRGRVLMTRRPQYMRSFPGAWVLPGGGVDMGESLTDAVIREVKEETGLDLVPESIKPTSIWESVYPTVPQPGVSITAHHIVVYLQAVVTASEPLSLQDDEVDCALWISEDDCRKVLESTLAGKPYSSISDKPIENVCFSASRDVSEPICLDHMVGIYPQKFENGMICGTAQGSVFALEELLLESSSTAN